jgi:hypothetical protein
MLRIVGPLTRQKEKGLQKTAKSIQIQKRKKRHIKTNKNKKVSHLENSPRFNQNLTLMNIYQQSKEPQSVSDWNHSTKKQNDRIISKPKAINAKKEKEPLPELRKAQLEMNLQRKNPSLWPKQQEASLQSPDVFLTLFPQETNIEMTHTNSIISMIAQTQ